MRIRTKRAALVCGSCLFACLVICAFLILSRPEETPLTLRGEVDAVSLYAHNVWFPGGEFQKKEVTGQADVDAIVAELTSIRCRNGNYPPDDLGGGWSLVIVLHYHSGEREEFRFLMGGDIIIIYPSASRGMYVVWPDGQTLWDRVGAPAEVINGEAFQNRPA